MIEINKNYNESNLETIVKMKLKARHIRRIRSKMKLYDDGYLKCLVKHLKRNE